MALNLKSEDLINLIETNEKGLDFWGDKKVCLPLNADVEKNKLPLHIVDNIINDEKNYMNLRLNFDKFKIEFGEIMENIKYYVKTDEECKKPIIYMQSYSEITNNFWLFIFYRIRENSIKYSDFTSSFYITKLIKSIKNYDYFKASICSFPCHINEIFIEDLNKNKINFFNPGMIYDNNHRTVNDVNYEIAQSKRINNSNNKISKLETENKIESSNKIHSQYFTSIYIDRNKSSSRLYNNKSFNLKNLFLKSLSFHCKGDGEEEIENIKNNFFIPAKNISYMDSDELSIYQTVKYDFLFLSERLFGFTRNLCFKMNSMVQKYMIYLEMNRNNTDIIEINNRKTSFFDIYVKVCEFKYKYYIISHDKILNFNNHILENLEKELNNAYSDIIPDDQFENLKEQTIIELITKASQINQNNKDSNNNTNNKIDPKLAINSANNIDLTKSNNINIPKMSTNKTFKKKAIKSIESGNADSDDNNDNFNKNHNEKEIFEVEDEETLKTKNFLKGKSTKNTLDNLKFSPQKSFASRKTSLIFLKLMESQNENVVLEDVLLNNKLIEFNIKLEHHIIIEYLIKGSKLLFDFYKNHLKILLLKKGINLLNRENTALIDLFNNAKSDLDVIKFNNKFSSSLLKNLDDAHYSSINKKFSFFETFFNKIQNVSLDVESHSDTSALLITKYEYEESIKTLIRDFIIYDANYRNFTNYTSSAESFGLFTKLKKQENIINILKEKLLDYDCNFEKICNAKLALQGNRTIYEMDNLYRQLKILRDNISLMEEYMKIFFEEKFKQIISRLKTQSGIIENKFVDFKENIISSTLQNILIEYNICLSELKEKHLSLADAVKSLQENAGKNKLDKSGEAENSFFEHFNREMEIETNFNKEINLARKKNDNLHEDVSKLHAYYRMKMNLQKTEYDKNLAELNQKLSSNQDLWDKLGIAEKNEKILKEELSKTQKSLAYAEEFNKKLQTQIRKSHNTNTNLEKQISMISANNIINNATKGENIKAIELNEQTKKVYLYNTKNNSNLVNAVEKLQKIISSNSDDENSLINIKDNLSVKDIKIILESLENTHLKYTQEVDSKRNFVNMLNKLKEDVTNMREVNKMNIEEANKRVKMLTDQLNNSYLELNIIKKNCLNPRHINNSHLNNNMILVKNNNNLSNNEFNHVSLNNGYLNSHSKIKEININEMVATKLSMNVNFMNTGNLNDIKMSNSKINLVPIKQMNSSSNNLPSNNNKITINLNKGRSNSNISTSNKLNKINQDLLNLNSYSQTNSISSKNTFDLLNNQIFTSNPNNTTYTNNQKFLTDIKNNNNKKEAGEMNDLKSKTTSFNKSKTDFAFNKTVQHKKQNELNKNLNKNILDIYNVNKTVNPIFNNNSMNSMNNNNYNISINQQNSEARESISFYNNNLTNNHNTFNQKNNLNINTNNNQQIESDRDYIRITKIAKLDNLNSDSSYNDSKGNYSEKKELITMNSHDYFISNSDIRTLEKRVNLIENNEEINNYENGYNTEENKINAINVGENNFEREENNKSNSRFAQIGLSVIRDTNKN